MAGTKRGAKAEAASPATSAKATAKDEKAVTPKTKAAEGKTATPKAKTSDGKTTTPKTTKAKAKAPTTAGGNSGKLPCVVQLPLTVALSFALSTLGSMVIAQVSRGELESLRRTAESREELAIVAGWKMCVRMDRSLDVVANRS